ncbi:hypothetical protein EVA_08345 [gut metagenome]|uniref:Uncharacterized protein n=1 Tax=gut metagenome TaxID=749906 RepID=J9G8L3_9ZZZZ
MINISQIIQEAGNKKTSEACSTCYNVTKRLQLGGESKKTDTEGREQSTALC